MPFIVDVLLSKGNMDQAATQKITTSFYTNYFFWDTPKVNKFIWISLLGTCQKWATSYEILEILYLGRPTSEQIHMNVFIWDVPKMSHSIPVVPHKAVVEVSMTGHYRRGELLWSMDGRANPLIHPKVVEVKFFWSVCNGCSGHLTHNCWM